MASLSTSRSSARHKRLTILLADFVLGSILLGHAEVSNAGERGAEKDESTADSPMPALDPSGIPVQGISTEPGAAPASDLPLYLEVFLGERPTGLIAHLVMRQARLFASPAELSEIGLSVDPALPVGGDGLIALDSLPGLTYEYQASEQRLRLLAPASLRPKQALGYRRPAPVHAIRGRGLLLNYDLYAQHAPASSSLAVGTVLRWFGAAGVIEFSGVSHLAEGDASAYQRLDTRWSYSDPNRLWTWAAGDVISGSLPWSRSVRLGGLQWRRNFAVRPDLITFPVPRFSGQATLPSTIELLINNVQQFSADIQDGPFALDAFPRVSGAGTATIMLRDTLGRISQTTVPIYMDAQRLAPGLSDFSLEMGKLRRSFGNGHDEYGPLVASGSLRWGASDSVTLETHAELGSALHLVGVGLVWSPWRRWGLVTASVALGEFGRSRGMQHSLGYQWNGTRFGVDLSTQRSGKGFRDIGSIEATVANLVGPSQDRISFWMPITRGSLAATWLRYGSGDGSKDRLLSLSWSKTFWRSLAVSANVFNDNQTGIGVGISVGYTLRPTLDIDTSVDLGDRGSRVETSLRHQPSADRGWGWELAAGESGGKFARASANVRGRLGDARFGADHLRGQTGFYAQAAGSVVWMAGNHFLSRRVNDAFAVVSSEGVAGVPVLYENRPIGVTDAKGLLLLTDLHGWQRNRISIDPDALAGNYRLPTLEQVFTPADGGGFEASFTLVALRPVLVVLLDSAGLVVPAGSRGMVEGSTDAFLVGFDGVAYLEDVTPGSVLAVELDSITCRYSLPLDSVTNPAAPVQLRRLSPIGTCR